MPDQPKPLEHTCREAHYILDCEVMETDDGPPQPRQSVFLECPTEGCAFFLRDGDIIRYIWAIERSNAALRDVRARASAAYNYWAGRDEALGQRMAELREALEKSKVDAPYPGGT